MTLHEAYIKFLQNRKANFVLDSSITTYKADLKPFFSYVGLETLLSDLTLDMVESYMASLNGSVKRNTAISYIRDMKILLVYADGLERLSFNPSAIKKPKPEQRDIVIYSPVQWEQVKASSKTYINWITLRNIAILTCIYDSGIRKMEVCSVRLSSFQKVGDKLFCTVYGKGLKERQVLFGKETIKAFEAYKSACPYDITDYFFLTKTGTPISGNTVSQFTYDIEQKLPFIFSCHILRHNYATRVCQAYILKYGHADLQKLSIYLGHESIKTTERYVHCAYKLISRDNAISLFDENLLCLGSEALTV